MDSDDEPIVSSKKIKTSALEWIQKKATCDDLRKMQSVGTKCVRKLTRAQLLENLVNPNIEIIQSCKSKKQKKNLIYVNAVKIKNEMRKGLIRDWKIIHDLFKPGFVTVVRISPCVFYELRYERSNPGPTLYRIYREQESKWIPVRICSISPPEFGHWDSEYQDWQERQTKKRKHPKHVLQDLYQSAFEIEFLMDFTFRTLRSPKDMFGNNLEHFADLEWQTHNVKGGTKIQISAKKMFDCSKERTEQNFKLKGELLGDRAIVNLHGRNSLVIHELCQINLLNPLIHMICEFINE